jgi:predicted Zn-dependent protease
VLFALGSACLRAGALPAAEECLAGAVARAPDRADYHLNHALCLLKSGAIGPAAARLRDMLARWPALAHARELLEVADRLAGQVALADSMRVGG